MEAIVQKYRILFNLQLVVEDFDGDLNQYFTVLPDASTQVLLSSHQMLNKKQKSAVTFVIRTEHKGSDDGKPWAALTEGEKYRFQVKLKENSFLFNTHLSAYNFVNQVLFVTNTTVNMSGNELLISTKLENYAASKSYLKGYLVKSGSNNYKALQPSDATDSHSVTEADYWKPITHVGASQADLVDRSSLTEKVDLDTIMLIEIDSSSSLHTSYRLLDTKSKVREVSYLIRFQKNN